MEFLKRRNNRRSNLNLNIRYGNRNQLGVTRRYQTGPESGTISYRFCPHENGTVRYRIVPISGSLFRTAQFLDLFSNGPLDFFRTRVNATPLRTTFWNGPKWNGTISYPCEQAYYIYKKLYSLCCSCQS